MRVLPFILIVSLSLTACAPVVSDALPALKEYSPAVQAQAADELDALPAGAVLVTFIADYAVLREQVRTLREVQH